MHSINSTQRAQGARKDSVQPGTTPIPPNKLQQVVKGGNNQAAEPYPEDSDVASSAPKDAVEYTLDAEAVSKGASFCATAGIKNNKAHQTTFIPPQKGAPHESLELGTCNVPMYLSHKCQDRLVDAQARLHPTCTRTVFLGLCAFEFKGARFSALQKTCVQAKPSCSGSRT